MKLTEFAIMTGMILAVLLVAGCTSNTSEVKDASVESNAAEPQTTDRYVELTGLDGTKIGGKYVSESAAFVTIIPMYILDKYGFMKEGNGISTGIKTSLVSTMIDIPDPTSYTATTLKAQEEEAIELAAAQKKEAEEKAAYYAKQKAEREAKENRPPMHSE